MRQFTLILIVSSATTFAQGPFFDPGLSQNTSPLLRGLVGCWRMEEAGVAGGTYYDASQYGNHLADNGGVSQTNGVSANTQFGANLVKASNQYLNKATTASLSTAGTSFEITGWFYLEDPAPSDGAAFVTKANFSGSTMEFQMLASESTTRKPDFQIKDSGGGFPIVTWGTALSTNTWHFIDAWLDRGSNVIGINIDNSGSPLTTASTLGTSTTSADFVVGRYSTLNGNFNGRIDEVTYHHRVLTSAERSFLYNSGQGTHYPWSHP